MPVRRWSNCSAMIDEKPFRIQPRRPRGKQADDVRILASGYKRLMHIVRASRRKMAGGAGASKKTKSFQQRCAIRITYSGHKTAGQWGAHGRYLMRDSASERKKAFDSKPDRIDAAEKLKTWQNEGDPRLFKIIVSPEFGERLDLKSLTRELMHKMEQDLGSLEWVAVEHHNTGHPHVHIALRGISEGAELRIPRQYIKTGIRNHAQNLCTRELGYRTTQDALEAQKREVRMIGFTSLDRVIDSAKPQDAAGSFLFTVRPGIGRNHPMIRRLNHLQEMQLAEALGGGVWKMRSDFGGILKAMQRSSDRQRMIADHGRLLSDPRLAQRVLQVNGSFIIQGRVLVHALDEDSGRPYMLLESTEGKIFYILHSRTIERARQQGQLRPNAFIEVQRGPEGKTTLQDMGDAEALLNNTPYLKSVAQKSLQRGPMPDGPLWGGWLGRWQTAISRQVMEMKKQFPERSLKQR
jgi:hypothetical protein